MKRRVLLAVAFLLLLFANVVLVHAGVGAAVSGPGGTATYHGGTNFRDHSLWTVDLTNIDYSALTDFGGSGKEVFQFLVHEWDGGLFDWALIGVQVHKENGAAAFQLFYDVQLMDHGR